MYKHRRNAIGLMFMVIWSFVVTACAKIEMPENTSGITGPIPDKVIYTVTTDEDAALTAVIDGSQDILLNPISKEILNSLSSKEREKLEVYSVAADTRSLLFNPVPNAAPYTVELPDEGVIFNPFAIREIRYALNWLINRQYIVDELFGKEGIPMFTAVTPGQPGSCKYSLIPPKLGMTNTGDEQRALFDIDNAMKNAAALPANRGKLLKKAGKWYYDEKPVVIKLVLRKDDPTGSILIGRYFSKQIEKAGFTVEELELNSENAFEVVYDSNPADYKWTAYTEYWGEGNTRTWWDEVNAQMYAPFAANMPGHRIPEYWNYRHDLIDKLAKKATYGQYLYSVDYWNSCLEVTKLGLMEGVRMYLFAEISNFITHKSRFNRRMIYGMGDGLNGWSIRTADIKPDTVGEFAGKKVLRVVIRNADEKMFISPWDPIGRDGFADDISISIIAPCSDVAIDEAPNNAHSIPLLSYYDPASLKAEPRIDMKGAITGTIPIPANTEIYDPASKTWKRQGLGETAAASATGWLKDGYYWHNGCAVTLADVRYSWAFDMEWSTKNDEDDPYFDPFFADIIAPMTKTYRGSEFHANGSVTNYFNYYFAPDLDKTAAYIGGLNIRAGVSQAKVIMPWEIYEALSEMLVHGSIGGTQYSLIGIDAKRIDLTDAQCVADIKAQLQKFIDTEHIPTFLTDFILLDAAIKRYRASIDFINTYHHAYISTGPFFISNIDVKNNTIVQDAVRKYPYDSWHWYTLFSQKMTRIKAVKEPPYVKKDRDAMYEIDVVQYTYPNTDYTPLIEGTVKIALQHEDGTETKYKAEMIKDGVFRAIIPAEDLAKLIEGLPYTVIITSSIDSEVQSMNISQFVLE